MTTHNQIIKQFRKRFINDHNRGEERFLRGLFIEDFEEFLLEALSEVEATAKEETARDILAIVDNYEGLSKNKGIVLAVKIGEGDAKIGIAEAIAKKYKLWNKYKDVPKES